MPKRKRVMQDDVPSSGDDASAVEALRDRFHAKSTTDGRSSAVKDFEKFCSHPKRLLTPFPLDVVVLERYAAVRLAEDHGATAKQYISHLRTHNKLTLRNPDLSEADAVYLSYVNKALTRDSGQEDYEPVGYVMLVAMRAACSTRLDHLYMDIVVIQFWLVARPGEVVTAVTDGAIVFPDVSSFRITFQKSKTDQDAVGRTIVLDAFQNNDGLCPVAAARRLINCGSKFTPTKQAYGRAFSILVEKAGFENTAKDRTRALFLPHGVRKGAAQSFLLGGVHRDTVQKQGGWKSRDSLLRYEDECMLDPRVKPLQSLLKSIKMMEEAASSSSSS